MNSVSSPVAAILNKLSFDRVDTKLSFAEFLRMIGLEFDEATQTYKIKINPSEGSSDDFQKNINELSVNDQLILISEIMNKFIRCEIKWDKIQSEQQKESEIGQASYTGEIASDVEEQQREITLLQKKHLEFVEGFKERDTELGKELFLKEITKQFSELDEKYRKLEKQYKKLVIEYNELIEENINLDNSVHQLEQKVTETETYSPPKPTSEKKAHRVAMIVRPNNMYKFVRVQEESLRKRLVPFIRERKQAGSPNITEDDFKDKFVITWPNPPHAVDSVDNVIKFLKENRYDVGKLEVKWDKSRGKLKRIVEAFLHKGAGGKEAAEEILRSPDV